MGLRKPALPSLSQTPTPTPTLPKPNKTNHRDFVLEAVSPTPGSDLGEETPRMDRLAAAYHGSGMQTLSPLPVDNAHQSLLGGSVSGVGASPWALFQLNLWRCALQLGRDKATLGLWAAVSALIGAMLGVLYWQQVQGAWVDGWGVGLIHYIDMYMGCPSIQYLHPGGSVIDILMYKSTQ